jgi:hypothetical protein
MRGKSVPQPFSIELIINSKGVQAVRIYGDDWEQPRAYAILERVGPLLKQLDALVKGKSLPEGPVSPKEPVQ